MEKIINYNNLRNFCYSNDKLITGEIKGIVLEFKGLGASTMYSSDFDYAIDFAKNGIIYVIPYYNPWAWMNRQTVKFVDEIVEVILNNYNLQKSSVKVASVGESMGGLSALVYCAYANITPAFCVTNCPVCDLVYHFTERNDLPRTLYSAFFEYSGTLNDALKTCSPYHLVDKMPNIPYVIYHCEEDKAVDINKHSLNFIQKMQKEHSVEFIKVPLRGHCDLPSDVQIDYKNTIINGF